MLDLHPALQWPTSIPWGPGNYTHSNPCLRLYFCGDRRGSRGRRVQKLTRFLLQTIIIPVIFVPVFSCVYIVFPKQCLLICLGTSSIAVERILKYLVALGSKENLFWSECCLPVSCLLLKLSSMTNCTSLCKYDCHLCLRCVIGFCHHIPPSQLSRNLKTGGSILKPLAQSPPSRYHMSQFCFQF